jgi:hypothetical protein
MVTSVSPIFVRCSRIGRSSLLSLIDPPTISEPSAGSSSGVTSISNPSLTTPIVGSAIFWSWTTSRV